MTKFPRHVYQMCAACMMDAHDLCRGENNLNPEYAEECECGEKGHGQSSFDL